MSIIGSTFRWSAAVSPYYNITKHICKQAMRTAVELKSPN